MSDEKKILEIKERISKLPPTPWVYFDGDDFDHWILVGNDSTHMVQDDSGVPPDPDLIDFLLHAVDDINFLISLINQPERSKREDSFTILERIEDDRFIHKTVKSGNLIMRYSIDKED